MLLVTWLISHVKEAKDGEIILKEAFSKYKFESIENIENIESATSEEKFSQYIRYLYPCATFFRRKKDSKKYTVIKGLCYKDPDNGNTVEFDQLIQMLPSTVSFKKRSAEEIVFMSSSGYEINGLPLQLCVSLQKNGTWSVSIGNTPIDLRFMKIDTNYIQSKEGIEVILNICNLLRVCEGVTINSSVICTRFHTTEIFSKPGEKGTRKLRSLSCKKVVTLTGKLSTCASCQKMTFSEKGQSQRILLQEKNSGQNDMEKLMPGAPKKMIIFLQSQAQNIQRDSRGRRWPKEVISVCLDLYNRSPLAYETLYKSHLIILPSSSLLILYKNTVRQKPGFHGEIFKWMNCEAERLHLTPEGRYGGIIIDEMAVQEDIQVEKNGNVIEAVGFVNKGEESNICDTLRTGKKEQKLGKHALQLLFIGMTGFRFPFAHFISDSVQGCDLHSIFWDAVDQLQMYGFTCMFTSMDGASSNRSFVNINIKNNLNMSVRNPCNFEENVIFMMDYSHVAKKIRNNIIKSGVKKGSTRNLILASGESIQWDMFVNCYEWDQNNALQINRYLTHEHIYLSTQNKMRNHLAEDVLNFEMLHLFERYQASLQNGSTLNGVIKLLKQTSKMVRIFRDTRPITMVNDSRITELQEVLSWFQEWRKAMPTKNLMSYQCHDDVEQCILGFIQLCSTALKRNNVQIIVHPSLINSDAVENTFCQQRATYNGANTNPTVLQYQKNLNSIIIGQSTISKKANAALNDKGAESYSYSNDGPLKKKRKSTSELPPTKIKAIRL